MTPKQIIVNDLIKSKRINKFGVTKLLFDQPYHLYLDDFQSKMYLKMIKGEKFSTLIHDPALKLIEKYKHKIIKDFKSPLSFYDLGPGFPTKTIPLLLELKINKIKFKYYPVDISNNFLKITQKEINKLGIKSYCINSLFENLNQYVSKDNNNEKLFFIGLTFNNYRPDKILNLLKKMSGKNGTCLIITEYFRKKNIETILLPYRDKYAENFNYLPLRLAGIKRNDLKYFTQFRNQRIEMGFKILRQVEIEGKCVLRKGTEIITAISYRYSKNTLIRYISKYFSSFEFYEHKIKDVCLASFKLSK